MANGYQREELYQPPGTVGPSRADVLGTLSERLAEFGNKAAGIYEEQAIPGAEQAGMEAAEAGKTTLAFPVGRVAKAYNDSLIRAYALDAFATANEEISRLETEAGTDLGKFKTTVAGYKAGALPSMLPAAQPLISQAIQRRESEGAIRIGNLAAEEAHADAIAQSERGLRVIQDRISRAYTAGTPEGDREASELTILALEHLKGATEGGLYKPREALAKRDLMFKEITREVAIGKLEEELNKPGGDPVKVIEEVMAKTSPMLSDEENQQLAVDLVQRLNLHQAVANERIGSFAAQWAAGEKEATDLMLGGRLTAAHLRKMVQDDRIDPSVARSMLSALKEGAGGTSDPKTEFLYRTNLLDLTEEEIRDENRLSWEDRATLIEKKRTMEGGWQDSNPAQEARGRIDRALGIVPGTLTATLTDEQKRQRGTAMSEWYDMVEAMPPGERAKGAITVAEDVIERVITRNNASEAARLKKLRENYLKGKKPENEKKRRQLEETVKRLDDRIKQLEGT